MRRLVKCILGAALIAAGGAANAQTTTVSGTVTDTNGQVWAYGSVVATLYNQRGGPVTQAGVALTPAQQTVSLVMNSSGIFSGTLLDNNTLQPIGTQWQLSVCSFTVAPCVPMGPYTVTGATTSLTGYLSAMPPPVFPAGPSAYGYADNEIYPNPQPGAIYYNTLSNIQRIYSTSGTWGNNGGGGGGGGATLPTNAIVYGLSSTTSRAATQSDLTTIIGSSVYDAYGAAASAQTAAQTYASNASNLSSGTVASARLSGTYAISISGLSATATALAATPTLCATGNAPTGILANGNATGCAAIGGGGGSGTVVASPQYRMAIFNASGTTAQVAGDANVTDTGTLLNVLVPITSTGNVSGTSFTGTSTSINGYVTMGYQGTAAPAPTGANYQYSPTQSPVIPETISEDPNPTVGTDLVQQTVTDTGGVADVQRSSLGTPSTNAEFLYSSSGIPVYGAAGGDFTCALSSGALQCTVLYTNGVALQSGATTVALVPSATNQIPVSEGTTANSFYALSVPTGCGYAGLNYGGYSTGFTCGPTLPTSNNLAYYNTSTHNWGNFNTTGTGYAVLNTAPTFGAGLIDAHLATILMPYGAGFATTANGNIGYDTTNLNWHFWNNGADAINLTIPAATAVTNGHCAQLTLSGSAVGVTDSGGACGGTSITFPSGILEGAGSTAAPTAATSAQIVAALNASPSTTLASALLPAITSLPSPVTSSASSAASTSNLTLTTAPYSAGNASTNYPLLYFYTTGATSPTTLNTNGTYIGINTASGYTGSFLDFHVNNASSAFSVSYAGGVTAGAGTFSSILQSTSSTSSAIEALSGGMRTRAIGDATNGSVALVSAVLGTGVTGSCETSHGCGEINGTYDFTTGTSPTTGAGFTITSSYSHTNYPDCQEKLQLTASPYTVYTSGNWTYSTSVWTYNFGVALTASTSYRITYWCPGY